jgi:hypothetical protein
MIFVLNTIFLSKELFQNGLEKIFKWPSPSKEVTVK